MLESHSIINLINSSVLFFTLVYGNVFIAFVVRDHQLIYMVATNSAVGLFGLIATTCSECHRARITNSSSTS